MGEAFHSSADESLATGYALLTARQHGLHFERMVRDYTREELEDATVALVILAGRYHELLCIGLGADPATQLRRQAEANALLPPEEPSSTKGGDHQ